MGGRGSRAKGSGQGVGVGVTREGLFLSVVRVISPDRLCAQLPYQARLRTVFYTPCTANAEPANALH